MLPILNIGEMIKTKSWLISKSRLNLLIFMVDIFKESWSKEDRKYICNHINALSLLNRFLNFLHEFYILGFFSMGSDEQKLRIQDGKLFSYL